jgi:diguanylate cyclase (GGDEF)-like protein
MGGWLACLTIAFAMESGEAARLSVVFSTFMGPAFVAFSWLLVDPPTGSRLRVALGVTTGGASILAWLVLSTPLVWATTGFTEGVYQETYGPLVGLWSAYFLGCLGTSIVRLLVKARQAGGLDLLRIQWVIMGMVTAAALSATANLILPLAGVQSFMNVGPLGLILFFGFTGVAVVRFHLLEIRTVVHMFAAWLLVSIILYVPAAIALYALFSWMSHETHLAAIVAAGGLLLAFSVYHRWAQPRVDRWFGRARFLRERQVGHFIEDFRNLGSVSNLGGRALQLAQVFRPMWAAIYRADRRLGSLVLVKHLGGGTYPGRIPVDRTWYALADEGAPVTRDRGGLEGTAGVRDLFLRLGADVLCPMQAEGGRPLGLLALGPKRGAVAYDAADLSLLESATEAASFAIQNALMYEETIIDPVTGLYNTLFLSEVFVHQLVEARRFEEKVGLVVARIENLAGLHEKAGHFTADLVVSIIAQRLRDACRSYDFVARIGGNDFAVVAGRVASGDGVDEIESRIVDATAEPVQIDGIPIVTVVKTGTAVYPEDGTTVEELLRAADRRLGQGKVPTPRPVSVKTA